MNIGIKFLLVLLSFTLFNTAVFAQTFGGRATGLNGTLTINGTTTTDISADTGELPRFGGNISITAPSTSRVGVFSTGTLLSSTSGFLRASASTSTVNDLDLFLPGVRIQANRVTANATCVCCPGGGEGSCSGGTNLTFLTLTDAAGNRTAVQVTGQANQVVNLPNGLGTITINEQTSGLETMTVNGLHINATSQNGNVYNLVVGTSRAQVSCLSVLPTPAKVTVSGRIMTAAGDPLAKTAVTLTDSAGNVRSTLSASDGTYSFQEVEVGRTYIIQAARRGLTFEAIILNLLDSTVVDITPSS